MRAIVPAISSGISDVKRRYVTMLAGSCMRFEQTTRRKIEVLIVENWATLASYKESSPSLSSRISDKKRRRIVGNNGTIYDEANIIPPSNIEESRPFQVGRNYGIFLKL